MTPIGPRVWFALAAIVLALSAGPVSVLANSALHQNYARSLGRCPAGTICDHALGIAVVPAPGVREIPPGHVPPHVLDLVIQVPKLVDFDERLDITSWGTSRNKDDLAAASTGMDRLLRGLRPHSARRTIRYGGSPGILARILATGPGPEAAIILAHHGALYKILAPGAYLARDQREMLKSLRFIPRIGPFPPENPSAPTGPGSRRNIPGGIFGRQSLTLTPANGLRRGAHAYSLWFHAPSQNPWLLSYSVPCIGRQGQLVVDVVNQGGRVVDRVLHRGGRAAHVRQTEEIGGVLRLDAQSHCANWKVTVSGIVP